MTDLLFGKRKLKNGQPVLVPQELKNLFLLNPHNRQFLLGKSWHIGGLWNRDWIAVPGLALLLLIGVVLAKLALDTAGIWWGLESRGVSIQGHVVSREWSDDSDSSDYLTYRFNAGRPTIGTYERRQPIDRAMYEASPVGAAIRIVYLPDDPQRSEIAGTHYYGKNALFTAAMGAASVFVLGIWVLALRRIRRLERFGYLLDGEVVACSSHVNDGDTVITLKYRFCTPENKPIVRSSDKSRNDLRKSSLPGIGTPVAVLYLDERLFRVL